MKAILKIYWQDQICLKIIGHFFWKLKKIAVSLIFHLHTRNKHSCNSISDYDQGDNRKNLMCDL